jgi:hypothetical protein
MMLLIDTRKPPPPDPLRARPAWEPNWRLWGWVALTIGAFIAADAASGVVAYLLVLAGFVSVCRAVSVILPPLDYGEELRPLQPA